MRDMCNNDWLVCYDWLHLQPQFLSQTFWQPSTRITYFLWKKIMQFYRVSTTATWWQLIFRCPELFGELF
jgi:hypothetical protein